MTKLTNGLLLLLVSALGCGKSKPATDESEPPATVSSLTPARDAAGVAINSTIRVTFTEAMDRWSLNEKTFVVTRNGKGVPGKVLYDGISGTFTPAAPLEANSLYTVTLKKKIKDLEGRRILSAMTWSFRTGVLGDPTAPTVRAFSNAGDLRVRFSEPMTSSTITPSTFTVTGPSAAPVAGAVSYDGLVASFRPAAPLAEHTLYSVRVVGGTPGLRDLAGNTMERDFTWSFNLSAHAAPPVALGGSAAYAIIAQTMSVTVGASMVHDDIGLDAAPVDPVFARTLNNALSPASSSEVVGKVYAGFGAVPMTTSTSAAVAEMSIAYLDAVRRLRPDYLEVGGGSLGGLVLSPGIYKWAGNVAIPSGVVLDGGPADVWIFQIAGDLTHDAGQAITLRGGARASNVFWQVAGNVEIGALAHFEGSILCRNAIAMKTGATLEGRAFAQTTVTLDGNTVTRPPL